ncbi:AfsR/SARP family transcriptional regulator [Amycolatopsis sp. NPDC004079]|uniref:AfsR/SARP family transcriptional regulator n=1 Tax=Amycolatopsis sp. NPDC004079 TaxID=3154549 RepID=UPI0033A65863
MRYEILGRLRVAHAEESIEITAPKVGGLLATLLVCEGQIVSSDRLIGELWGSNPPKKALSTLHVHMSQLRKTLELLRSGRNTITTRSSGYLLAVRPGELDAHEFRRLAIEGRDHARGKRHEEAVTAFDAALCYWRGPVLEELRDAPIINNFASSLEETRLECVEARISSNQALGRYRETVGDLVWLVAQHPLHEELRRKLMLALFHSGRRAEALEVYDEGRRILDHELGLGPSKPLSELHRSILSAGRSVRSGAGEQSVHVAQGGCFQQVRQRHCSTRPAL